MPLDTLITESTIQTLNRLSPGAGNEIARAVRSLAAHARTLTGKAGPVQFRNVSGVTLNMTGNRISNVADPIGDRDIANYRSVIRLLDCDRLLDALDGCEK